MGLRAVNMMEGTGLSIYTSKPIPIDDEYYIQYKPIPVDDEDTAYDLLSQYVFNTTSAEELIMEVEQSLSTDIHFAIFGIPVTIEEDGDFFIVSDSEISKYGIGDTREEAIEDYKSVILEYFEILNENEEKLSEHLKRHLYYLRMKEKHFGTA